MKFQRGDAGAGMLLIMAVMMIGLWVGYGQGGGGHHSRESVINKENPHALLPSPENTATTVPSTRLSSQKEPVTQARRQMR